MGLQHKVKIICEEVYKDSIGNKQILEGLTKELKRKRITFSSIQDSKKLIKDDNVFIVGASRMWLQRIVEDCNCLNIIPIVLSNQEVSLKKGRFHLVCSDLTHMLRKIKDVCLVMGKEKVALYGVQNLSQIQGLELVRDTGDIYINNVGLESCFQSFRAYVEHYDAVVCLNGYAAISLVKKLESSEPRLLNNLTVISCEEILLSAKYKQHITFVDMKLDTFGETALSIMELTAGKENLRTFHVLVDGIIDVFEQKKSEQKNYFEETEEYLLFADPEEVCMARVEQLLECADEVDRVIIELLMNNATYSQIADDCYMTEGNVKYRVKKYLNICKVGSKRELLELLCEYLPS